MKRVVQLRDTREVFRAYSECSRGTTTKITPNPRVYSVTRLQPTTGNM